MYKITSIDPKTGFVYITFQYGDAVLDHSFQVENVDDAKEIQQEAEKHYKDFVVATDASQQVPDLPADVQALIDEEVQVK